MRAATAHTRPPYACTRRHAHLQVGHVLPLAAVDHVVDLDGAVRRARREHLAVVVQLHIVLRAQEAEDRQARSREGRRSSAPARAVEVASCSAGASGRGRTMRSSWFVGIFSMANRSDAGETAQGERNGETAQCSSLTHSMQNDSRPLRATVRTFKVTDKGSLHCGFKGTCTR